MLHGECNEETLKNIGRIAWYLAHAMPLERGSASTLEMFVTTLMVKNGFELNSYQNNVTLDLEAMFEPDKERYANNFMTWFQDCFPKPSLSLR